MATSDTGRPTNTGKFALVPASWDNQREKDVSDSMRETLERNYSLDTLVNSRFQGRTNVAAYELRRNKTEVSIKEDWDGSAAQFTAKAADDIDYETMTLAWPKVFDLARTSSPWQDQIEAQIDPEIELGDKLANALVQKFDDNIWSLMMNADLTAVRWDYVNATDRNQVLKPEGSATNFLGDEAVKTGTDPLILPLVERFISVLSKANQGSGQVSRQQRYSFLMSMDCLIQLQRELGSLRNEQLVQDEINGNWRTTAWELFRFVTSNAVQVQDKISTSTGAVIQSGGKKHHPIHVLAPDWATSAIRMAKTLTEEPFTAGNKTMNWQSAYTAQHLRAIDDDRYIWRGWIRAEA